MADKVTTYQCPACMGPLKFSGESGKLECEYCGSSYTVENIEKLYAEKEKTAAKALAEKEAARAQTETGKVQEEAAWGQEEADAPQKESSGNTWTQEEAAGMKTYSCPSCGAELLCDAAAAATSCPYCGNPAVIPGQFAGGLKPDLILPFKKDKKTAKTALMNFYKGKKFLPDDFKEQNHIEEMKGVYVPFWLYDCTVSGTAEYNAGKVRVYRRGEWQITETSHYQVRRSGTMDFVRVPADGSVKMPDAYMDAVEPFDYRELETFSTAYLPGFFADKYDVDKEQGAKRAGERMENSMTAAMQETVQGYDTVLPGGKAFQVKHRKAEYALLPVWLLSTRWNGENFLFAMNGQTGRLVGDLPVDKKKYWTWFAGITAVMMAVFCMIWFLFNQGASMPIGAAAGLVLSMVTAFAVCSSFKNEMKTARLRDTAQMYIAQNGLTLTEKEDRFLRVTQTRQRVQNSSSHGGRGPGNGPVHGPGPVSERASFHGPGASSGRAPRGRRR